MWTRYESVCQGYTKTGGGSREILQQLPNQFYSAYWSPQFSGNYVMANWVTDWVTRMLRPGTKEILSDKSQEYAQLPGILECFVRHNIRIRKGAAECDQRRPCSKKVTKYQVYFCLLKFLFSISSFCFSISVFWSPNQMLVPYINFAFHHFIIVSLSSESADDCCLCTGRCRSVNIIRDTLTFFQHTELEREPKYELSTRTSRTGRVMNSRVVVDPGRARFRRSIGSGLRSSPKDRREKVVQGRIDQKSNLQKPRCCLRGTERAFLTSWTPSVDVTRLALKSFPGCRLGYQPRKSSLYRGTSRRDFTTLCLLSFHIGSPRMEGLKGPKKVAGAWRREKSPPPTIGSLVACSPQGSSIFNMAAWRWFSACAGSKFAHASEYAVVEDKGVACRHLTMCARELSNLLSYECPTDGLARKIRSEQGEKHEFEPYEAGERTLRSQFHEPTNLDNKE